MKNRLLRLKSLLPLGLAALVLAGCAVYEPAPDYHPYRATPAYSYGPPPAYWGHGWH